MIDARGLDKPVDHASCGPLRALYKWVKPATPSPHLPSSPSAPDHGDVRCGACSSDFTTRLLGPGGLSLDCPCQLPKVGMQGQQQPSRSVEEVVEARGFARKTKVAEKVIDD